MREGIVIVRQDGKPPVQFEAAPMNIAFDLGEKLAHDESNAGAKVWVYELSKRRVYHVAPKAQKPAPPQPQVEAPKPQQTFSKKGYK